MLCFERDHLNCVVFALRIFTSPRPCQIYHSIWSFEPVSYAAAAAMAFNRNGGVGGGGGDVEGEGDGAVLLFSLAPSLNPPPLLSFIHSRLWCSSMMVPRPRGREGGRGGGGQWEEKIAYETRFWWFRIGSVCLRW